MKSSSKIYARVPVVLKASGEPHADLANIGDSAQREAQFFRVWRKLFEVKTSDTKDPQLFPREALDKLQGFSFGSIVAKRDLLRKAWAGDSSALNLLHGDVEQAAQVKLHFQKKEFQIVVEDFWPVVAGLFLIDYEAGRTGVCENPDCEMPYFIKRRSTQVLCQSETCIHWKQKKFKTDYWHRTGSKQRAKQNRKR